MSLSISIVDLEARYVEHYSYAKTFAQKYSEKYSLKIEVNAGVLLLVVKSAYDDIERYKQYHLEDPINTKSDAVKRVAYLAKWLVKLRPFFETNPDEGPDKCMKYLANEFFAINMIGTHIEGELSTPFQLSDSKAQRMVYDLLFREVNGDGLLKSMQDIYDLVQGKPPVELL